MEKIMEQAYSYLVLLKVIALYLLLFYILPARAIDFEEESDRLDRFYISLIHSTIIIIFAVHLLAFIRLYETISLIIVLLGVFLYRACNKGCTPRTLAEVLGMRIIVEMLDMSEGRYGLVSELNIKGKIWLRRAREKFISSLKFWVFTPFKGFLLTAAFGAAAYLRFKHSLEHFYFGASDSYLHLVWSKYMAANDIYVDGIYPYGYQAIISALNKLFFIDPYYITRFIGPLAGFLMVFSLYYFIKKNNKSEHIPWLAVVIYGIVIDARLPSDVWRQISALPMEYAAVFFLPGLHFFNMYFRWKNKKYLFLAAECVAITLLIHPYVTVFLGIGCLVVFACNIRKNISLRMLGLLSSVMGGAIFLGVLPMIIGMLLGFKFHGSLGYVQRSASSVGDIDRLALLARFSETNPYFRILFVCIVALVVYWLIKAVYKRSEEDSNEIRYGFIVILTTVLFYGLYRAKGLGLPVLMDPARVGVFLALMVVVVYVVTLSIVMLLPTKKGYRNVISIFVCLVVLYSVIAHTPMVTPKGAQYEYDDTVKAYLDIKREYPIHDWTIISPVEQYQLALGYGWHYEIWEFARDVSGQGRSELKIPTSYVFLIVEKVPFKSGISVEEVDATRDIPKTLEDANESYYQNVENRALIQAKAFHWAEEYVQRNTAMTIYRDTDFIRIYMLEQDINKPVNLLR